MTCDPIRLEIFKHLFASVAEEMGTLLRKASYSPNIKERRDYSCALFDAKGWMIAQAAHIPVHLGSMPLSVSSAIHRKPDLQPGDMVILNDPFCGGSHLPDITLVSPVFLPSGSRRRANRTGGLAAPIGFIASRAHHADVGGMSPGSMPVAREIFQEGLIIPPVKIMLQNRMNEDLLQLILSNVRTPGERRGDLMAQISANQRGVQRMIELVQRYGLREIQAAMAGLLEYTGRMTRRLLQSIPGGIYQFSDLLDDDGLGNKSIPIAVTISIRDDSAVVDFTHSAPQQAGSVNAVYAITLSAVYYVFRCLLGLDVPNNAGCLAPIQVIAPEGSIVNARFPAAVAGGNVETSQRIVDVLLGALAKACPGRIPAASQGTMNNVTLGGLAPAHEGLDSKRHMEGRRFTYYETIGGGTGAGPTADGISAIHSHMTNTLNTPIEALEYAYPLRVLRYALRKNSGGKGEFHGGDGIIREIQVLRDCQVTLLSERRRHAPYGLCGGGPGKRGANILRRGHREILLPGKGTLDLRSGDILIIRTPGGGGFGPKKRGRSRRK